MSSSAVSASGSRRNPLVRLLSSIWFGITCLLLILAYGSVASALAPLRGAVEMTEMQIFRHWLFVTLIVLFCTSLISATLTRIRWNLLNVGVLTVHSGLLLLVGGAAWYFGTKVEGDVILRSPRIELVTLGDGGQVLAALPAEPGRSWSSQMPVFGGPVQLVVVQTRSGDGLPVAAALVRARVGQSEAQRLTLAPGAPAPTPLSARLGLRLVTFPAEESFYEQEAPALYYRRLGAARRQVAEIRGLPVFRERYLDDGQVLRDSAGRPVPSKRTSPQLALAGIKLPTGWFEHWRMPIRLQTPGLPFEVEVTGYLPYVSGGRLGIAGGGARENPAIDFTLSLGARSIGGTLLALDPARSLSPDVPLEFRWVRSRQEREQLLRPLAGAHELYIELRDPPLKQTLAVVRGQRIRLANTAYELTVDLLSPGWRMKSPGFEGALSPVAQVSVVNGRQRYRRTVVARFPELTQDVDEQGVRHRDGPYDPNLILRYRAAGGGRLLVVAGADLAPQLAVFDADGQVLRFPLAVGRPRVFEVGGQSLSFTLNALHRRARQVLTPTIVPLELRRPRLDRQMSAIRLRLRGRGELAGWQRTRWCFYSPYPHVDPRPIVVRLPGQAEAYELTYSRRGRALGAALMPQRLSVTLLPGGRAVESWRSDFWVKRADGSVVPAAVHTNHTYALGRWTLFQSGAAQDHWGFTILGVGNRRGIWPMVLGCTLVTLGCLYAFYVKPVLLRRRPHGAAGRPRRAARPRIPGVAGEPEQPELLKV